MARKPVPKREPNKVRIMRLPDGCEMTIVETEAGNIRLCAGQSTRNLRRWRETATDERLCRAIDAELEWRL